MKRVSGVQQSWTTTTFRAICLPTKQWNPIRDKREKFQYIDVSAVGRNSYEVEQDETLAASAAPSRARKIVLEGDCIFATVRPRLLRVAYVGREHHNQIASTAFCVLRADHSKANPRFIYFLLRSSFVVDAIANHESGASYPAVSDSNVLDCEIALPPKSEQETIAAVLWKLQRAIATQDRLIAATRDLKQSAMSRLFTSGLRGEPLKETEIGSLPDDWTVAQMGDCLELAQYGLSIRGQPTGSHPILRMNCQDEGQTIFRNLQFVDMDTKTLTAFRLKAGDLLFNRTNSFELVGRTSIFRENREAVFASYLIRLTLDESKLYPEFLNYYLNQQSTQKDLKRLASRGVSQSNISASKLKGYPIPVPSLDEQRDIAAALTTIDRKLAHHQKKRAALNDLFQTLLHKLMTGEIRVADIDIDTSEITAPPGAPS